MDVVSLSGQRGIFDAEVFGNIFNRLGAVLYIVLKSSDTGAHKSEDFARTILNLFFGCADTAGRVAGQVIARVSKLSKTFAMKNQRSWRRKQTGGNELLPQSNHHLLGSPYNEQRHVF